MRNETLIAETGRLLAALSEEQARTVRDFAAFLAQQAWHNLPLVDDNLSANETEEEFAADMRAIIHQQQAEELSRDLTELATNGGSFDWLHEEPDLYTDDDLIERYK